MTDGQYSAIATDQRSVFSRPLTWVVLIWNGLMGAWLLYALYVSGRTSSNCDVSTYSDACKSGAAVGTGIAIFFIFGLAAFGDTVLGVIWLVTRKNERPLPTGGFQQPTLSGSWERDPSGRHESRYWDGRSWTHHVSNGGQRGLDPL